MSPAVPFAQDQRCPLLLTQPRKHVADLGSGIRSVDRLDLMLMARAFLAHAVEPAAPRNTRDPGRIARAPVILPGMPPCLEERFLRHVVRIGARHSPEKPAQCALVLGDEQ